MAGIGPKIRGVPGSFLTDAEKLARGIWPWTEGVRSRLPEFYKQRLVENHQKEPVPVHYRADPRKYHMDEYGVRHKVQNIPLPILYPKQANQGLWGGEGIIQGFRKRDNNPEKPRVPRIWKPMLTKRVFYSEILDRWMAITVTHKTLDLVDESYGFDSYILQTHEIDLKSSLGMRLKREMLMVLITKSMYPGDPKKGDKIYEKYKHHIVVPEEEVPWMGLTIEEAEKKQDYLEEQERIANTRPMKEVYMEELIQQLQENKVDDVESSSWLSKLNPFTGEKPAEKS